MTAMSAVIKALQELDVEQEHASGLEHWLNCEIRCFGDKGDVEDITEGGPPCSPASSLPTSSSNFNTDPDITFQPTSYPPSSSITQETIWRPETKAVG